MSAPKFIDELPPEAPRNRGRGPSPVIEALRKRPGQWAEVGRYATTERQKASMRAAHLKRYHANVEAATRTVGGEVIVFARATVADGADQ